MDARPWRWDLRGARRLLSTGPMHHLHMRHLKKESKTMVDKMVLAVAPGRYR